MSTAFNHAQELFDKEKSYEGGEVLRMTAEIMRFATRSYLKRSAQ